MLVLTRRLKEKIVFPSIQTEVQVLGIRGNQVRLGVEAPAAIVVLRDQITDPQENWHTDESETDWSMAGTQSFREIQHRLRNRFNEVGLHLAVLHEQLQRAQTLAADSTITRIEEDLRHLRREFEEELAKIGAGSMEEASSAVAANQGI